MIRQVFIFSYLVVTHVSGYIQSETKDFYELYKIWQDYGDYYQQYQEFGEVSSCGKNLSCDRVSGDFPHSLERTNLDMIDLQEIYSSLTNDSNVLQNFIKKIVEVKHFLSTIYF